MTMSLHVSTPPGAGPFGRLAAAWRAMRPHLAIERTREASHEGVRVSNLMIDVEWPVLSALWGGAAARRSFAFYVVDRRLPSAAPATTQPARP